MDARADEPRRPDDRQGTLGGLLYADRSKSRIPEADWAALVRGIAARDQLALRALYERAHALVFTLALRITASREIAEELTVDVFHDLWRRAPAYDPANGTVLGWIMNQARSRSIDRVRHDTRRKRVAPGGGDGMIVDVNEAERTQELAERGRILRAALDTLSAQEREAIEVAYFGDFTHAETAARLGAPLGTIKTRIRGALIKLRKALGNGRFHP
jgi:RNA polymerase sigma-70 factor (ECF subfamily)